MWLDKKMMSRIPFDMIPSLKVQIKIAKNKKLRDRRHKQSIIRAESSINKPISRAGRSRVISSRDSQGFTRMRSSMNGNLSGLNVRRILSNASSKFRRREKRKQQISVVAGGDVPGADVDSAYNSEDDVMKVYMMISKSGSNSKRGL